jgi:predicted solute-binding protein
MLIIIWQLILKNMAIPKKKISIPNSFEYNFLDKRIHDFFDVVSCDEEICSKNLFYENTEIAIISPVEYAKNAHIRNYMIIPEIGVSYNFDFPDLVLIFKPSTNIIQKIAHRSGKIISKFLTDIIFRENYDIEPDFHPDNGLVEEILKKYDSLILSGDEAAIKNESFHSKLYLAQEWAELTELPFTAGIWVAREDALEPEELNLIINLQKDHVNNLFHNGHDHEHGDTCDELLNEIYPGLKLSLGEDEVESLKAQFEYSFFYGFSEEIPDLKFYEI